MDNPKPRHRSFIFPVLLILMGAHFLSYNLGWTDWNPWKALVTLWPVFIVALGLDILLRRLPMWASILGAVLFAALLLLLVGTGSARHRKEAKAEWGHVQRVEVPLGKAVSATLDLQLDAGELRLSAAAAGGSNLVEGEARLPEGARLIIDQDTTGPEGRVRIESERGHEHGTHVNLIGERNWDHRWDLALVRSIPIEVSAVVNAGTFDLDFSDLNVKSVKAEVNAGTGTLTLSKGATQGTADLTVQAGTLDVSIPPECAARIRAGGSLNTVRARSVRFMKTTDGYEAAGDGKGACRWEITVQGNLSSLSLR